MNIQPYEPGDPSETWELDEARRGLRYVVSRAAVRPQVICRSGAVVAAIVSVAEFEAYRQACNERRLLAREMDPLAADERTVHERANQKAQPTVPADRPTDS